MNMSGSNARFLAGANAVARRRGEEASAVLIVIAVIGLLALLGLANAVLLSHLKSELRLLELRQRQAWEQRAPSGPTNSNRAHAPVVRPAEVQP